MGRFRWIYCLRIVAITILTTLAIYSCSETPQKSLRIAINLWPGYEPLYLARNLGYFDNTNIQIVEYGSNTERVRAYRNGDVEITSASMNTVLEIAETNPDTNVFLIADFSSGADAIISQPHLSELQSLKGKKIGLESSTLGLFILTRALEQVNLSREDVQITFLEIPEQEAAFKQNLVDAVVTYGSTRTNLLATGAKPIFDTSAIPGEIVDTFISSKQIINSHREEMKVLGLAWFSAINYIKEYPQQAAQIIAQRQRINPEQFLESLEGIRFISLKENQQMLSQIDPIVIRGTERLAQFLHQHKLLKKEVDLNFILDDQLVRMLDLEEQN